MELGLGNSLLTADPRLIDHVVGEVKSQGIFDQFRKECHADVDTKPAYQNLRTRVESSVNTFLNKQTWRTDLNKNQLRETLRKHIHEAPYLEVGVERIVDQVVNPKIYSVFMPQIEDVVYKFMGIERPRAQRNGVCDLKDLLPKDLDPVSPESDRNSLKDVSLESVDVNVTQIANGKKNNSVVRNIEEEMDSASKAPTKKDSNNVENGESFRTAINSSVKTGLNSSVKSDETNKTEEEEEASPVFEPIDVMNLNESNISNDSHLSEISELTSHRSRSPDFITELSRDNFDYSNQDSQLSKISSNSHLSIVTDFGSSNHASTPLPEAKEDIRNNKDSFKAIREFDISKENKFNFEVIKNKDASKISNSSKENSRDASEYRDSKIKEEFNSKLKYTRDRHESRNSRDKDRDLRRRHSNKSSKYSRSKSKDKSDYETQESKDNFNKYKENKVKDLEKKEDTCKEVKDLKDLYKEKIRELREKKELTEKEKLGKDNKDSVKSNKDLKDKKDTTFSKEKDDKKSYKSSSSSSRSSSYHSSRISRTSESKDSRDRTNSKRDDRHHSNDKSDYRSGTKSRRDSKAEIKSDNRSSDRSLKDKKRRDERKSKSTDDHSSLRKNSNDRRSTDRDGSNGSGSKYSYKSSYSANSSSKLAPSTNLTKENNKDHHSNGEVSDSVHDSLQMMFGNNDNEKNLCNSNNLENFPKRVDPGSTEISLPLKKRPLQSDENVCENQAKKLKLEEKKVTRKKVEDIFKNDMDVTSVPDEERVQIIEIPDEEYEQPYPDKEPIFSLEETKKIILDAEPVQPAHSKLSEMEQSIRESLNEMMSDHKIKEINTSFKSSELTSITDSAFLIETLTDGDYNDDSKTTILAVDNYQSIISKDHDENIREVEKYTKTNTDKIEKVMVTEDDQESLKHNFNEETEYKEVDTTEKVTEDIETIYNIQMNIKKENENSEESIYKIEENLQNIYKIEKDLEKVDNGVAESKTDNKINEFHTTENSKIYAKETFNLTEKEVESSVEKIEQDSNADEEKEELSTKEFEELTETSSNYDIDKVKIEIKDSLENLNNEQNDDSIDDNTNEYNEEDKLIIDEEFDEKDGKDTEIVVELKDNNKNEDKILSENEENNLYSNKNNEKEEIIKEQINFQENLEEQGVFDIYNNTLMISTVSSAEKHIESKKKLEEIIDEEAAIEEHTNDSNESDNYIEKSVICNEDLEKVMTDRFISDKGNENVEKQSAEIKCTEISIPQLIKDQEFRKSIEAVDKLNKLEEKLDNEQFVEKFNNSKDRDINFEDADDNIEEKVYNREDENTEIEEDIKMAMIYKLTEDEIKLEKEDEDEEVYEVTEVINEDSTSSDEMNMLSKLENIKTYSNTCISRRIHVDLNNEPSISGEASSTINDLKRNDLVKSPIEEDCYYLEGSNHKYLAFKKYLEKLEADPSRSLEDMIDSFGGIVVPAKSVITSLVARPLKRKLSTSPLTGILVTNSNNNNDRLRKEASSEENSYEITAVTKKRKVGRMKKASSTIVNITGTYQSQNMQRSQLIQRPQQPLQPQQQQIPQQQQMPQQPQQQPQIAIVNGENFIMPLSPDSDVSATSDKYLGNALKDEKSRLRNNQRYSSDDLYKPRPLFSSSSRRNRRFHQA